MTAQDDAEIARLWRRGLTAKVIAEAIGRPANTVRSALWRMGLGRYNRTTAAPKPRKPPREARTPEELRIIRALSLREIGATRRELKEALPHLSENQIVGAIVKHRWPDPISARDRIARCAAPLPAEAPIRGRDDEFVAAVLAQGGYPRAELRCGRRVLLNLYGAPWTEGRVALPLKEAC